MQSIRDLALVLRSTPFQERHRMVVALTEKNGLITALAKNSIQSRRFGGSLEPFAASEWLFTQKPNTEIIHLSEAQIRQPFENLRKTFEKFSLACVLNEFMLKLAPPNTPCIDLFRLHSNSLSYLNDYSEKDVEISLLNTYLSKFLQWNGNQPRLYSCRNCNTSYQNISITEEVSCLVTDASWICSACRNTEPFQKQQRDGSFIQHHLFKLNSVLLQDFQMMLKTPIRQAVPLMRASDQDHRELFKFLEALYIYHIPGFDQTPLKSLRFLGIKSSMQHPIRFQR